MYRMGKEEIDAVARVIESKQLFKINKSGQEVFNFENELREKFNVENVLMMTSGKASLISALIGLGIGPGDEVIVPAYTYMATALAVTAVGAIPVIAEIDETLAIDPADVEKKITPNTKAVMPVHMQGMPCNMDALMALGKKYGVKIVEDACQADGGTFKGKNLGTIGDAGALSFNQFKIITAGEGGALLTNDKQIYQRGNEEEEFCGVEYRANEITAAIMRVQLTRLDGILADLRRVKKTVMNALKDDFKFVPSNDAEGDCGVVLALRFDSEKDARHFQTNYDAYCCLPIDTGKHVYSNWAAIINKKGAVNPNMDPFKMEANKNIIPNYTKDMCPKSLDYLARTVLITLDPDWTDEEIDALITRCKNAK